MLEQERRPVPPEEKCTVPTCPVAGPVPHTCVCWEHRLCYSHMSAYATWAEGAGVINRAPSPTEWRVFLSWVAAKQPAEVAA